MADKKISHKRTNSKFISRKYGHIKSIKDSRDLTIRFNEDHVKLFAQKYNLSENNPTLFDLRNFVKLPEALSDIDQGSLGSCTANAISFAYAFNEIKQSNKDIFLPSRLFIYYNERLIEGTVNQDSGAQLVDGIKAINKYGVCDEHHWIYDPLKFTVEPPKNIYEEAKNARAVKYASIDFSNDHTIADRIKHLKIALQSGYPVVFGFTVFSSFETEIVAQTGIVPIPSYEDQILGGHAVCAVGFDESYFIVKNSWGPKWGKNGYFYMPAEYLADPNLADDFWIITNVLDPIIPNFNKDDINPDAINLDNKPNNGGVVHN